MTSMVRRLGIVASFLVLVGAAGAMTDCGGRAASRPPAVAGAISPEDDDAAAGLMDHHRHHHHGGVTLFIAMSLDTLGVSPEQQAAVERIRTELHARMEPARAAEQRLMTTLADGVAAGTLDAVKADAAVRELTDAAATVHDTTAGTVNELHDLLTPPQRAALIDKVQAHWAVWQKANAEEGAGTKAEDGRLALLSTELALTPDQVTRIRAGLSDETKAVPRLDAREIAAYITAFGEAFRGEKFDAKTLSTANGADARLAGWGGAQWAHFVGAMSPVLSPDQRVTFAQHLRDHAAHNPSAQAGP